MVGSCATTTYATTHTLYRPTAAHATTHTHTHTHTHTRQSKLNVLPASLSHLQAGRAVVGGPELLDLSEANTVVVPVGTFGDGEGGEAGEHNEEDHTARPHVRGLSQVRLLL